MLRNFASGLTLAPPNRTVAASEELGRLRKAMLYADVIEAGGISAEAVDGFAEGQWAALALIAGGKPPSSETCSVIRKLVHQRKAWRERLQNRPAEVEAHAS
jgi:hypothetical protein